MLPVLQFASKVWLLHKIRNALRDPPRQETAANNASASAPTTPQPALEYCEPCAAEEQAQDDELQGQGNTDFSRWCTSWLEGMMHQEDGSYERRVLLLGQTGHGKSAFLNLLDNFPTVLRYGRAAFAGRMRDVRDAAANPSSRRHMESQTIAATTYGIDVGPLLLTVIDTPGFADTSGQEVDKKNPQLIVDCVKKLGFIDAIAIVVSGRESRLTYQLKFVLMELCAILPRTALDNIVVVFTNTSCDDELTFSMDDLNNLLAAEVPKERQIFIDNPYVKWERYDKKKRERQLGEETELAEDARSEKLLARSFKESGSNLAQFLFEILRMPRASTDDFEGLFELRKDIERTSVQALTELEHCQAKEAQLAEQRREIERARGIEAIHRQFTKRIKGKRWCFKDAPRHGTFCGAKNCHSNCHAPCFMEKTLDNLQFRNCSAFRNRSTRITLESAEERSELLRHTVDSPIRFRMTDGDSEHVMRVMLSAPRRFDFKGHSFIARATVHSISSNLPLSLEELLELPLPTDVKIRDRSEPDICKKCGHHRNLHYHDNKVWVEEEHEEDLVDITTQMKYEEAKDAREKQEALLEGVRKQIEQCKQKQTELAAKLLHKIQEFQGRGLASNYAMLLQNQRDLLDQHMQAALEVSPDSDLSALKKMKDEVEKQLQVVLASISCEEQDPEEE